MQERIALIVFSKFQNVMAIFAYLSVYLMMLYAYSFISYLNFIEYFRKGYSKLYNLGMLAEGSIGALIVSKASLYYERFNNLLQLNDFTFYIFCFGLPLLIIRFFIIKPMAKKNAA